MVEAKDTVMSEENILRVIKNLNPYAMHRPKAIAKVQAEISFKAGVKSMLELITDDKYANVLIRKDNHPEFRAKLKELGITWEIE